MRKTSVRVEVRKTSVRVEVKMAILTPLPGQCGVSHWGVSRGEPVGSLSLAGQTVSDKVREENSLARETRGVSRGDHNHCLVSKQEDTQ